MRLRILVIAGVAASLGAAAPAFGHGDPTGHYLETEALYPSLAARPSQAVELQLLGVLQAVQRDGYPVKVALVGSEDDLADMPSMFRRPQRYAEELVRGLEVARPVTAPVLVITPHGMGVAGRAMVRGVYGPVTRAQAPGAAGPARRPPGGRRRWAGAGRDRAVRRVARLGGHALPADVAPARLLAPGPSRAVPSDGSAPGWLPFAVFAAVFLLGVARVRAAHRAPRRRRHPLTP